jgi:hypothetical protein
MSAAATIVATALAFSPVNSAPPPTYFVGGTDFSGTGTVTEGDINWLLNGELTGAQNVPYPRSGTGMDASIDVGANAIVDILDEADGPVRIAGVSQGALAIASAKRKIMALDEADRPDADEVVFVAIGDPSSATGIGSRLPGLHVPYVGVTFTPAPETPYQTIIITREYDGLADFPDRPLNLIATLNALAGVVYVHPVSYGPDTDLDAIPEDDVTETVNSLGGRTTTYFVQNEHLPLLQPLRDMGVDERVVSAVEQPLKQIVDAGYSRNDGGQADTDDEEQQTARPDWRQRRDDAESAREARDPQDEKPESKTATNDDKPETDEPETDEPADQQSDDEPADEQSDEQQSDDEPASQQAA